MTRTPRMAAPVLGAEAGSTEMVPIEGTVVGEHGINPEAPGCAEGTSWRFESTGAGDLAGLGEVEYVLSWCSVSDPETGITSYGEDGITFTTAAGDSLETAQIGYGWLGGTEQFVNATGNGWLGGLGQIPGDATIDLGGAITLSAAGESE